MNIKGIALALLLGASFATGARAAQSLNPLGGVIIGTPGSGQSLQNYTFSCSVTGCATGSVEPALELTQGGAFLSVTNGLYSNLLQGNAVIASGNPLFITGTGTAGAAAAGVQTVQGIASMTPFLVNPGTATNWGVLGQGSTTSGELGGLSMGAVTTASPTYTTAQTSPLSLDTTGALRVNVTAGGGSGGTSAADASTWTAGTTAQTAQGCEFTTGGATALVTAHMGTVGCTAARGLFTDKSSVTGTALATATESYGTNFASQTATVERVDAYVTNSNNNGSATSANSSPVVIASDQVAVAVKAASASFASGSIASGALAAGSISSGAAVSGAYATGAIADLAVAQGATTSGKVGNMGLAAVTTAAPTYTTAQLDPLSLDTAGNLRTLDSQAGTWNITNISGTVSLPTGASTSALQPTNAAQGSTTSGQTGHLMEGAVTTAAPTYTTAQTSPISLDTAGNLRINCITGCAGGAGGTSATDEAAFTAGTSTFTGVGAFFQTTATNNALTTGQWGSLQATANRALFTNLRNAAGAEIGTSGTPVQVSLANTAANGTAVAVSLAANQSVNVAQVNGVATLTGTGAVGTGAQRVAVGTDTATIAGSAPSIVLNAAPQAITTGGGSQTGNIAANNTTAVVVKASAGTLYSLQLSGIGSAPAYLKIYNATSATCGSGTPVGRYMIPAASTAANGGGSNVDLGPVGVAYGTGITYCVTAGITDADTTAPAASTFLVNLVWK